MWDNVSWLDALAFALNLVTFAVAWRVDRRQSRMLEDIRRREAEIQQKVDGKGEVRV